MFMFTRTEQRGVDPQKQRELLIFTHEEGADEHSPGAVHHVLGSDEVTIRSNVRSWGSVPVQGRESLLLLRDALIEICKREGIE